MRTSIGASWAGNSVPGADLHQHERQIAVIALGPECRIALGLDQEGFGDWGLAAIHLDLEHALSHDSLRRRLRSCWEPRPSCCPITTTSAFH